MVLESGCGGSHYPLLPGWVNKQQQDLPLSAEKSDVRDRWDLRGEGKFPFVSWE